MPYARVPSDAGRIRGLINLWRRRHEAALLAGDEVTVMAQQHLRIRLRWIQNEETFRITLSTEHFALPALVSFQQTSTESVEWRPGHAPHLSEVLFAAEIDGIHELLTAFEQSGLPFYIASGNTRQLIDTLMVGLGGAQFAARFAGIYTPPEFNAKAQAIQLVTDRHGTQGKVLMIGDAANDIHAAHAVPGTIAIGRVRSPDEARSDALGADHYIVDYADMHWDATTRTLRFTDAATGKPVVIEDVAAVVFDFDGTLIDSAPNLLEAYGRHAAELAGVPPDSPEYAAIHAVGANAIHATMGLPGDITVGRLLDDVRAYLIAKRGGAAGGAKDEPVPGDPAPIGSGSAPEQEETVLESVLHEFASITRQRASLPPEHVHDGYGPLLDRIRMHLPQPISDMLTRNKAIYKECTAEAVLHAAALQFLHDLRVRPLPATDQQRVLEAFDAAVRAYRAIEPRRLLSVPLLFTLCRSVYYPPREQEDAFTEVSSALPHITGSMGQKIVIAELEWLALHLIWHPSDRDWQARDIAKENYPDVERVVPLMAYAIQRLRTLEASGEDPKDELGLKLALVLFVKSVKPLFDVSKHGVIIDAVARTLRDQHTGTIDGDREAAIAQRLQKFEWALTELVRLVTEHRVDVARWIGDIRALDHEHDITLSTPAIVMPWYLFDRYSARERTIPLDEVLRNPYAPEHRTILKDVFEKLPRASNRDPNTKRDGTAYYPVTSTEAVDHAYDELLSVIQALPSSSTAPSTGRMITNRGVAGWTAPFALRTWPEQHYDDYVIAQRDGRVSLYQKLLHKRTALELAEGEPFRVLDVGAGKAYALFQLLVLMVGEERLDLLTRALQLGDALDAKSEPVRELIEHVSGRYEFWAVEREYPSIDQDMDHVGGVLYRALSESGSLNFEIGSMEHLPRAWSGQFHMVMAVQAFRYASDKLRALEEIHRVLAPHGEAALDLDPDVANLSVPVGNTRVPFWQLFRDARSRGHQIEMTRNRVGDALILMQKGEHDPALEFNPTGQIGNQGVVTRVVKTGPGALTMDVAAERGGPVLGQLHATLAPALDLRRTVEDDAPLLVEDAEQGPDLLAAFRAELEHAPPGYTYAERIRDVIGYAHDDPAHPDLHSYSLHQDLATNPLAALHEFGEFLHKAGQLKTSYEAANHTVTLAFTSGRSVTVHLTNADALTIIQKADASPSPTHYHLWAAFRQIFGQHDEALTAQIQAIRDAPEASGADASAEAIHWTRQWGTGLASTYAPQYVRATLPFWQAVLTPLGDRNPHARILDAGSGALRITRAALAIRPTFVIDAVDIAAVDPARIRDIRPEELALLQRQVRLHQRSMAQTGLQDASIDAAIGAYALEYTPDMGQSLREIARVLRPGAEGAFLVHHPDSANIARARAIMAEPDGVALWRRAAGVAQRYLQALQDPARDGDRHQELDQFIKELTAQQAAHPQDALLSDVLEPLTVMKWWQIKWPEERAELLEQWTLFWSETPYRMLLRGVEQGLDEHSLRAKVEQAGLTVQSIEPMYSAGGHPLAWALRFRKPSADEALTAQIQAGRLARLGLGLVDHARGLIRYTANYTPPTLMYALTVVAHPTTRDNARGAFQGRGTPDGGVFVEDAEQQARAAAEAWWRAHGTELAAHPDRFVFLTSRAPRAQATAALYREVIEQLSGGAVTIQVQIDDQIGEMDFGAWDGLTLDEIEQQLGPGERQKAEAFRRQSHTLITSSRGGESFADRLDRTRDWLTAGNATWAGKQVVAFGHGRSIAAMEVILRTDRVPVADEVIEWARYRPDRGRPVVLRAPQPIPGGVESLHEARQANAWSALWRSGLVTAWGNQQYPGNSRRFFEEAVQAVAHRDPRARMLDIGTGNLAIPRIALAVAPSLDVHGLDIAEMHPELLTDLSAEERARLDRVTRHQRPAEDSGFDNESVALVTGAFALEYTDMDRTLAEIARILTPGGSGAFLLHHPDGPVIRSLVERLKPGNQRLLDRAFRVISRYAVNPEGTTEHRELWAFFDEMLQRNGRNLMDYASGLILERFNTIIPVAQRSTPSDRPNLLARIQDIWDTTRDDMLQQAVERGLTREAVAARVQAAGLIVEELDPLSLEFQRGGSMLAWKLQIRKPGSLTTVTTPQASTEPADAHRAWDGSTEQAWERSWSTGRPTAWGRRYEGELLAFVETFVREVESRAPNGRLLDVGTGNAEIPRIAVNVSKTIDVHGLDSAHIDLSRVKDITPEALSRITIHQALAQSTGLESDSIDGLSCGFTLEYTPIQETLTEFHRLMRSGAPAALILNRPDSHMVRVAREEVGSDIADQQRASLETFRGWLRDPNTRREVLQALPRENGVVVPLQEDAQARWVQVAEAALRLARDQENTSELATLLRGFSREERRQVLQPGMIFFDAIEAFWEHPDDLMGLVDRMTESWEQFMLLRRELATAGVRFPTEATIRETLSAANFVVDSVTPLFDANRYPVAWGVRMHKPAAGEARNGTAAPQASEASGTAAASLIVQAWERFWRFGVATAMAERYTGTSRQFIEEYVRSVESRVPAGTQGTFLDVYTGNAEVLRIAAETSTRLALHGVDSARVDPAQIRGVTPEIRARLTIHHRPAEATEFEAESVDGLSSAFGLEYSDDPAVALAEFFRVMRPGAPGMLMLHRAGTGTVEAARDELDPRALARERASNDTMLPMFTDPATRRDILDALPREQGQLVPLSTDPDVRHAQIVAVAERVVADPAKQSLFALVFRMMPAPERDEIFHMDMILSEIIEQLWERPDAPLPVRQWLESSLDRRIAQRRALVRAGEQFPDEATIRDRLVTAGFVVDSIGDVHNERGSLLGWGVRFHKPAAGEASPNAKPALRKAVREELYPAIIKAVPSLRNRLSHDHVRALWDELDPRQSPEERRLAATAALRRGQALTLRPELLDVVIQLVIDAQTQETRRSLATTISGVADAGAPAPSLTPLRVQQLDLQLAEERSRRRGLTPQLQYRFVLERVNDLSAVVARMRELDTKFGQHTWTQRQRAWSSITDRILGFTELSDLEQLVLTVAFGPPRGGGAPDEMEPGEEAGGRGDKPEEKPSEPPRGGTSPRARRTGGNFEALLRAIERAGQPAGKSAAAPPSASTEPRVRVIVLNGSRTTRKTELEKMQIWAKPRQADVEAPEKLVEAWGRVKSGHIDVLVMHPYGFGVSAARDFLERVAALDATLRPEVLIITSDKQRDASLVPAGLPHQIEQLDIEVLEDDRKTATQLRAALTGRIEAARARRTAASSSQPPGDAGDQDIARLQATIREDLEYPMLSPEEQEAVDRLRQPGGWLWFEADALGFIRTPTPPGEFAAERYRQNFREQEKRWGLFRRLLGLEHDTRRWLAVLDQLTHGIAARARDLGLDVTALREPFYDLRCGDREHPFVDDDPANRFDYRSPAGNHRGDGRFFQELMHLLHLPVEQRAVAFVLEQTHEGIHELLRRRDDVDHATIETRLTEQDARLLVHGRLGAFTLTQHPDGLRDALLETITAESPLARVTRALAAAVAIEGDSSGRPRQGSTNESIVDDADGHRGRAGTDHPNEQSSARHGGTEEGMAQPTVIHQLSVAALGVLQAADEPLTTAAIAARLGRSVDSAVVSAMIRLRELSRGMTPPMLIVRDPVQSAWSSRVTYQAAEPAKRAGARLRAAITPGAIEGMRPEVQRVLRTHGQPSMGADQRRPQPRETAAQVSGSRVGGSPGEGGLDRVPRALSNADIRVAQSVFRDSWRRMQAARLYADLASPTWRDRDISATVLAQAYHTDAEGFRMYLTAFEAARLLTRSRTATSEPTYRVVTVEGRAIEPIMAILKTATTLGSVREQLDAILPRSRRAESGPTRGRATDASAHEPGQGDAPGRVADASPSDHRPRRERVAQLLSEELSARLIAEADNATPVELPGAAWPMGWTKRQRQTVREAAAAATPILRRWYTDAERARLTEPAWREALRHALTAAVLRQSLLDHPARVTGELLKAVGSVLNRSTQPAGTPTQPTSYKDLPTLELFEWMRGELEQVGYLRSMNPEDRADYLNSSASRPRQALMRQFADDPTADPLSALLAWWQSNEEAIPESLRARANTFLADATAERLRPDFLEAVGEANQPTGRVVLRAHAHGTGGLPGGVPHRTVQVLVVTPGAEAGRWNVLLQQRGPGADTSDQPDVSAGRFDISVGGHVDFGRTPLEAASQEMAEEAQQPIDPRRLIEIPGPEDDGSYAATSRDGRNEERRRFYLVVVNAAVADKIQQSTSDDVSGWRRAPLDGEILRTRIWPQEYATGWTRYALDDPAVDAIHHALDRIVPDQTSEEPDGPAIATAKLLGEPVTPAQAAWFRQWAERLPEHAKRTVNTTERGQLAEAIEELAAPVEKTQPTYAAHLRSVASILRRGWGYRWEAMPKLERIPVEVVRVSAQGLGRYLPTSQQELDRGEGRLAAAALATPEKVTIYVTESHFQKDWRGWFAASHAPESIAFVQDVAEEGLEIFSGLPHWSVSAREPALGATADGLSLSQARDFEELVRARRAELLIQLSRPYPDDPAKQDQHRVAYEQARQLSHAVQARAIQALTEIHFTSAELLTGLQELRARLERDPTPGERFAFVYDGVRHAEPKLAEAIESLRRQSLAGRRLVNAIGALPLTPDQKAIAYLAFVDPKITAASAPLPSRPLPRYPAHTRAVLRHAIEIADGMIQHVIDTAPPAPAGLGPAAWERFKSRAELLQALHSLEEALKRLPRLAPSHRPATDDQWRAWFEQHGNSWAWEIFQEARQEIAKQQISEALVAFHREGLDIAVQAGDQPGVRVAQRSPTRLQLIAGPAVRRLGQSFRQPSEPPWEQIILAVPSLALPDGFERVAERFARLAAARHPLGMIGATTKSALTGPSPSATPTDDTAHPIGLTVTPEILRHLRATYGPQSRPRSNQSVPLTRFNAGMTLSFARHFAAQAASRLDKAVYLDGDARYAAIEPQRLFEALSSVDQLLHELEQRLLREESATLEVRGVNPGRDERRLVRVFFHDGVFFDQHDHPYGAFMMPRTPKSRRIDLCFATPEGLFHDLLQLILELTLHRDAHTLATLLEGLGAAHEPTAVLQGRYPVYLPPRFQRSELASLMDPELVQLIDNGRKKQGQDKSKVETEIAEKFPDERDPWRRYDERVLTVTRGLLIRERQTRAEDAMAEARSTASPSSPASRSGRITIEQARVRIRSAEAAHPELSLEERVRMAAFWFGRHPLLRNALIWAFGRFPRGAPEQRVIDAVGRQFPTLTDEERRIIAFVLAPSDDERGGGGPGTDARVPPSGPGSGSSNPSSGLPPDPGPYAVTGGGAEGDQAGSESASSDPLAAESSKTSDALTATTSHAGPSTATPLEEEPIVIVSPNAKAAGQAATASGDVAGSILTVTTPSGTGGDLDHGGVSLYLAVQAVGEQGALAADGRSLSATGTPEVREMELPKPESAQIVNETQRDLLDRWRSRIRV